MDAGRARGRSRGRGRGDEPSESDQSIRRPDHGSAPYPPQPQYVTQSFTF